MTQLNVVVSLQVVSIDFFCYRFCSFSYSGVCYKVLKLSANDIIVSQKVPMENESSISLRRDYNFTAQIWAKKHLWAEIHFESIFLPGWSFQKALQYKKEANTVSKMCV